MIPARGPRVEALPDGLPEHAADAIAVNGIAKSPRSRDSVSRIFNGFNQITNPEATALPGLSLAVQLLELPAAAKGVAPVQALFFLGGGLHRQALAAFLAAPRENRPT